MATVPRPCWALLLAGGRGQRMGTSRAKQLIPVAGHPLLCWAFHALAALDFLDGMVVVAAADLLERTKALLLPRDGSRATIEFVAGGRERQQSVAAGLLALPDDCQTVLVHDGARPFIGAALVERLLSAYDEAGCRAVVPGLPETNTIKRVDRQGFVSETILRQGVYEVQTPQLFATALLRQAHQHAIDHAVSGTDDAALVEALGERVRIVDGEWYNLKVTTKRDIFLLNCLVTTSDLEPGGTPPAGSTFE